MALDVHLSRDIEEPWGFELFGGADEEMPLTIEKIEPDTPAKRAGLLNGDTILTINGEEAIDMSLKTASRKLEGCGHSVTVGVLRGLYDPVLDYTEPLYDYGLEDLGPQSEPTEVVFQVQRFVEPSDIGSKQLDLGDFTPGTNNLTESRSLTASPFVTPTKPYRPFSTEPVIEVPPLEDPIILNPNYRDEFGKSPIDNDPDYLIRAHLGNALGSQARYKLPVSEQYDPDGTNFKQNVEIVDKLLKYEKHVKSLSKDLEVVDVTKEIKVSDDVSKESSIADTKKKQSLTEYFNIESESVKVSEEISKREESIRKDSKSIEKQVMFKEEVEEESIREELQQIEKMRQENDSKTIEEIAKSIVEESIERAVSVTEDIKKEMDEEMSSSEKVLSETKEQEVSKLVKPEETESHTERKMSREERIETQEEASLRVARKDVKESEISETVSKKDGRETIERKSLTSEEHVQEEVRGEPRRKESFAQETYESKGEFKKVTKTVTSDAKTTKNGAEQRAYTIGLQTIPNIRGVVHSSYHYDLLLRTFFIHLTDVMVALSRFLLSQPIFNQLSAAQEMKTYEEEKDFKAKKSPQEISEKVEKRAQEERMKVVETKQVVKPVPVKETIMVSQKIEKEKVDSVQEKKVEKQEIIKPVAMKQEQIAAEVTEKKLLTGAQMAQRSEKKLSKEMTQKMDAVISEFQTVAVEEDVKRVRRPSSRSQIEEEVMKESDPLEWLSKLDNRRTSQETTEITKKEFSSSETIERRSSKVESGQETRHKKTKAPKQTYIAIVESHVYTNKDAVFEEYVNDFSETSSVQSAEEINNAVEAIEIISAENVAIESAIKELETAKMVEEKHELATVKAQAAATAQKIEEVMHDSKELVKEEYRKENAIKSHDIQEVLIQETKEIIEPVVEIKETKIENVEKVAVDINESLAVAQSTEVSIEESKNDIAAFEVKKESAAMVEEERVVERVIETKTEVIEPKPVEIVEITETIKIKPKEEIPVHEEYAEIKIVKTVPVDAVLSPEIIEVEDISELISKTVVNDVGGGNQVEIGSAKHVTISSEISMIKPESKQSAVDMSQGSQVSSQVVSSKVLSAQAASSQAISAQVASPQTLSAQAISAQVASSQTLSAQVASSQTLYAQVASSQAASSVKQELTASQKTSESTVQESSFTAKSGVRKLSLRTDLESQGSAQSPPSTIDTPTPSTVPPTPLTDEYMFKLNLPLPKSRSATPVPRDCSISPDEEDPNIVKKKLIPHIETTIERVVYDPPLPTPAADKVQSPPVFSKPVLNGGATKMPVYSKPGLKGGAPKFRYPVYRKPGLFGGADRPEYCKEEIREIERRSSLLASAIDETIKSIEEYKEEVGIDTKKETKRQEYTEEKVTQSYEESYNKEIRKGSKAFEEIGTKIEEIIQKCDASLAALDNMEANKSSFKETENEGIVTEVIENYTRKESIENELQPIEYNTQIDNEHKKTSEKTVKFENEFQIVDEPKDDKRVEVNTRLPAEVIAELRNVQAIRVDEARPTREVGIPVQTAYVPEVIAERKEVPRTEKVDENVEKSDALLGFRPVEFDPDNIQRCHVQYDLPPLPPNIQEPTEPRDPRLSPYLTETGEQIGTIQGIVDGLEEPVMNEELAKQLGKPGLTEEKIATLISGEAEMLREAHVMGLSRVLTSHMHRVDDSSVDFQKIKPMIDSLKDSEVLKALNEEMARQKAEEKKKEEKKWTTFLQKPKRPVPKAKFGYHGWTEDEQVVTEPYKVQIVKQPKPKVAPDYKPEDFETGPLPWEERADTESSLPPLEPEEPILIPEVPEFLEAVDPLTESEVPDLEDTGIPLPPPKEPTPPPTLEEQAPEPEPEEQEVPEVEQEEDKQETGEDMENRLAEQLVRSVQGLVDPNATVEQQLTQMRAQLAALAQLPEVIQQSLELVTRQLSKMNQQQSQAQNQQQEEVNNESEMPTIQEANESEADKVTIEEMQETQQQQQQQQQQNMMQEQESVRMQTPVMTEEEIRMEKQRKEQQRLEHESRQLKHHPTPRVAPKRMFGPLDPEERRAVILPGGRRWRKSQDVYDEQLINETLQAQSELIMGKAMGFESDLLPYDNRINFMKYEKPPVSLDHLKHSEVYKLIHDEEQAPSRRIEMRTPLVAMSEADYRERCRSMTPATEKKHVQIPQQFHP